jgi:hypothetical protein
MFEIKAVHAYIESREQSVYGEVAASLPSLASSPPLYDDSMILFAEETFSFRADILTFSKVAYLLLSSRTIHLSLCKWLCLGLLSTW